LTKTFKTTALAVAFASIASFGISSSYAADISVEFNPGVVQYGYTDGYWTRTHEWRTWERPEHIEVYRKTPHAAYYEYRHDRDPDMGWRVR
jgi:hypothetical protein